MFLKEEKAFTLVELIVVITILAILATVAFISFQGSTEDARNGKVKSDVANLAKKATIMNAKGISFSDFLGQNPSNELTSLSVASGATMTGTGAGDINFAALQESADDFSFDEGPLTRDYIYSYVSANQGSNYYSYFQVAGRTTSASSTEAVIKGNYTLTNPVIDSISLIGPATGGAVALIHGSGAGLMY